MTYMQALIDRAAANLGSRYKVAQALSVPEESIRQIVNGARPLPLEWLPALCRLTGDDFEAAFSAVATERGRTPGKSESRTLFGSEWRGGDLDHFRHHRRGEKKPPRDKREGPDRT